MHIYYLVLINVILLVIGQTLWKIGLSKIGGVRWDTALAILFSPYILAGLFLYVIATVIWFIVLSRANLSTVYPMQSLAYIFGVLVAWLVFS